jgi:hypothetical protein
VHIGLGGLAAGIIIAVWADRHPESEATVAGEPNFEPAGANEAEADQMLLELVLDKALTEERAATVCDSLDRYGEDTTRRAFVASYEVVAGRDDPPGDAMWDEIRSRVDCICLHRRTCAPWPRHWSPFLGRCCRGCCHLLVCRLDA